MAADFFLLEVSNHQVSLIFDLIAFHYSESYYC